MTFFQAYKKTIIGGLVTLILATGIPTLVWVHNAYADDRYVIQEDALRTQIAEIDHALFEIGQEIMLATNPKEKAKWIARKDYYERQKDALKLKITNPNKK